MALKQVKTSPGKAVGRNDVSLKEEEEIDREAGKQPKVYKGGSGRDASRTAAEEHDGSKHSSGADWSAHKGRTAGKHENHDGNAIRDVASSSRPRAPAGHEHLKDSKFFSKKSHDHQAEDDGGATDTEY